MRRHVQPCSLDKVGPAGQDAGGLWPAHPLAAGEGHKVGTVRNVRCQVVCWRQHGRAVNDYRHILFVGDGHYFTQRQVTGERRAEDICDGGRLFVNRRRQLLGKSIFALAPFPEFRPCGPIADLEPEAVFFVYENLVFHPRGIGQLQDAVGVLTRHAGRRLHQQARRRPGHYEAGLCAGVSCQSLACPPVQLVEVDECICRIDHCLLDLCRHPAPAEHRHPAPAIDDSLQPEAVELRRTG